MSLIYSDPSYQAEILATFPEMHCRRLTTARALLKFAVYSKKSDLDASKVDSVLTELYYSSDYLRVYGVELFEDVSNPFVKEFTAVWDELMKEFMMFFNKVQVMVQAEQLSLSDLTIPTQTIYEELKEFVVSADYYFERARAFSQE